MEACFECRGLSKRFGNVQALDEVIFLKDGKVNMQSSVDDIREQYGKSVDALFREVFKC